ncbi:MAG: glycosyltransferase [Candidatus Amesbacteria bacterium]|nr:glycosyltransferase [Candidatus Amesbacteria bacterium]
MAKVSIVVTVFNEEKTIKELLDVLVDFKAEVIIVDGGSTDKTVEKCKKYKGTKVIVGKYNRSEGRNIGVAAARGEIVAFTDAGCVPEKDWLKELLKVKADVVAGYYKGLPQNVFEKCLVPYVLVMPDRVGSEFLPSTRSMMIKKDLFLKMGGFNEKLDTSEDFEFANRLKKAGVKIHFAKDAVVGWYPRKNLKQAAWMFLKFAVTDIYAGIMRPKVKLLILRYYLYFFLLFLNSWLILLIIPYLLWSIFKNYKYVRDWRAIYWLPVIQLTADCMVIFGTVMGLLSKPKK